MAGKSKYDWEAIWVDYRAGIISVREVAKKHKIDHSYLFRVAKKKKIKRDLTQRVKEAFVTKMVTGDVPTPNVSDDEIVDVESNKLLGTLNLQRKDVAALRELETKLIAELDNNPKKLYMTQYQGKIVEKEVGLTAAERAQAANNLANVQHKRIALERQAYNMDATGNKDDPLGAILDEIAKRAAPLVEVDD